ncbi:translocase of outer mitochondrial membrane40-like protein [Encephalitozoon romaleae SJ-2008]|uniref:Translocase of outer mitochondrial membrane40-like protein n=1 Tax=Encephalitozoon romaleae (strain SJ-2008) TaxID=1178016 RepID=I7AER8_ENCRO|nr:translocase of outer mitochondrial membrane40-like protein [Encephalitozoon romaleae SJ-2008]AFN83135.1 translocase of outer mitochondrial membrane40-like protein [Encephalitozoon romaleae SJ-2008]
MRWISNILRDIRRSCSEREITSTFDTYNAEANEIVTSQTCSGVRTEISKTIFPFLQVSRVDILDRNAHVSQMFGTLSLKNSLVQVSMDHENSIGVRAMNMYGNLATRIHTIITGKKEVFSQVEMEMKNRISSFGLKMISPAIKSTGMVYVANTLQQFGSLSLGAEIIGADTEVGISMCGRYEHRNGVFSVGLQQFTALSLSYYHKIGKFFDIGAEIQAPRANPPSAAIGCRLSTSKTQVKANVNSDMSLGFYLGERLTEGLTFNVNAEVNKSGCSHGFGFSLEF